MKRSRLHRFFVSPIARVAGTYLLIIMVMSIGFSIVLYNTSSQQLGRQLPPNSLIPGSQTSSQPAVNANGSAKQTSQTGQSEPPLDQFLQKRISQGRSALMTRLIYLNIGALLLGGGLSYILARRSLRPIQDAMEAQAQFVSDASHELRTPLTAIQTSNEVFMRKPKISVVEAKQLIEQNTNDVKRLKDLSDGLLNLSQHTKQAVKTKPIHIQDIMSEALTQIITQATQKNITLHDDLKDIVIRGDLATLRQALVILLDNAVKYSDNKGSIYLTSYKQGKYGYVAIRDEGIGIRASDLPHLFRRFYRADNARTNNERSGYGLGLPIAKQILDNQDGSILVESVPNEGSTFTLKLPLA